MCLALTLALAACAGAPPLSAPASRGEDEKQVEASRANIDVDHDVRADFETAMAYLRDGKNEKGTALLTKVAARSPHHSAPHINLAIAYQKMGNLAAAEESVKRALAISPEHPVANTEYGLIYRKTGRFIEARKSYEAALAKHPGFLPARKNLGILCDVYLRDPQCALTHYRVYSSRMPDDNNVRIWIADLEQRLGKQQN